MCILSCEKGVLSPCKYELRNITINILLLTGAIQFHPGLPPGEEFRKIAIKIYCYPVWAPCAAPRVCSCMLKFVAKLNALPPPPGGSTAAEEPEG